MIAEQVGEAERIRSRNENENRERERGKGHSFACVAATLCINVKRLTLLLLHPQSGSRKLKALREQHDSRLNNVSRGWPAPATSGRLGVQQALQMSAAAAGARNLSLENSAGGSLSLSPSSLNTCARVGRGERESIKSLALDSCFSRLLCRRRRSARAVALRPSLISSSAAALLSCRSLKIPLASLSAKLRAAALPCNKLKALLAAAATL